MTLALWMLLACGDAPPDDPAAITPAAAVDAPCPHHAADLPADAPVRGTSIYQLEVALTDQDGAPFPLGGFAGHPTFVSMVYTSCTAVCPVIVADLQRVDAALAPEDRARARYLLVSLDPARDDAAARAGLAARHDLDARWKVLRAEPDDVREIAAVLGIRYRALPDGEVLHSSVITLLDEAGAVDTSVEGLGKPTEPFVARVGAMNRGS